MRATRPYAARRPRPSTGTRERIAAAVRELLEEGTFFESSVGSVADRAGVSRATLYQHFGSRLGLVDAVCETFAANPALLALRDEVDLDAFVMHCVGFWASEEKALAPLYGVAAVDPAAAELVERQGRDRLGELRRLIGDLRERSALRAGLGEREALSLLSVLTSFETFRALRRGSGMSQGEVVSLLQETARRLLRG